MNCRILSSVFSTKHFLCKQPKSAFKLNTVRFSSSIDQSQLITGHPYCNVTPTIAEKVGRNLHLQENHPINILKTRIENYFDELHANGEPKFTYFDDLKPIVSTKRCFDDLLTPKDHVSRKQTDTYYVDPENVLRTHTSAHQTSMMEQSYKHFLVTGDCYRRDEIDSCHYPIFHQMEGVRLFPELNDDTSFSTREAKVEFVLQHLKRTYEGLVRDIFGDVEMRWVDAYFPFTDPSLELEIFYNGDWLEVLGCGVIQQEILRNAGLGEEVGWACGMGMERLAMVLFNVPDIRLFWSRDPRFLDQFQDGEIKTFTPFSKYPPCFKDVSFWHGDEFHENDLCELARGIAGDIVEQIQVVDEFVHPKTQRTSKCYRITYRHMERNLTNEEVDKLQMELRDHMVEKLGVELR